MDVKAAPVDAIASSNGSYRGVAMVGSGVTDAELEARFAATRADPASVTFLETARTTSLVRDLLGGKLALEWTRARLVYDDPAKTLDQTDRKDVLLFPQLVRTMGRPEKTFDLVSPYFVPGDQGTASLVQLAGIRHSSTFQLVATILKVVLIVAFLVCGFVIGTAQPGLQGCMASSHATGMTGGCLRSGCHFSCLEHHDGFA